MNSPINLSMGTFIMTIKDTYSTNKLNGPTLSDVRFQIPEVRFSNRNTLSRAEEKTVNLTF